MLLTILYVVCTLLAAIIAIVGDTWPPGGRVFSVLVVIDLIILGLKAFGL